MVEVAVAVEVGVAVEVEVEVGVEEEVVVVVAEEGYLQERHLQVEPHLFKESWVEIHQPNSMETKKKAKPFYLRLPYIEE